MESEFSFSKMEVSEISEFESDMKDQTKKENRIKKRAKSIGKERKISEFEKKSNPLYFKYKKERKKKKFF